MISTVTAEQLEEQGFSVTIAADARQAEREFELGGDRFEMAVLDVNLGSGPSGYDLALSLRKRRSDLPIEFTTADAAGPVFSLHLGRAAHVGKPYTLDELTRALRLAAG